MGSKKSCQTFTATAPKGSQSAGAVIRSTWLGGLADTKLVDTATDQDDNNLHVLGGRLCPKCGRPIESDQVVRRIVSGDYVHDAC